MGSDELHEVVTDENPLTTDPCAGHDTGSRTAHQCARADTQ
jgi:hypothetical protein